MWELGRIITLCWGRHRVKSHCVISDRGGCYWSGEECFCSFLNFCCSVRSQAHQQTLLCSHMNTKVNNELRSDWTLERKRVETETASLNAHQLVTCWSGSCWAGVIITLAALLGLCWCSLCRWLQRVDVVFTETVLDAVCTYAFAFLLLKSCIAVPLHHCHPSTCNLKVCRKKSLFLDDVSLSPLCRSLKNRCNTNNDIIVTVMWFSTDDYIHHTVTANTVYNTRLI